MANYHSIGKFITRAITYKTYSVEAGDYCSSQNEIHMRVCYSVNGSYKYKTVKLDCRQMSVREWKMIISLSPDFGKNNNLPKHVQPMHEMMWVL